eukprot:2675630-Prymnesium_polylepis.1
MPLFPRTQADIPPPAGAALARAESGSPRVAGLFRGGAQSLSQPADAAHAQRARDVGHRSSLSRPQ